MLSIDVQHAKVGQDVIDVKLKVIKITYVQHWSVITKYALNAGYLQHLKNYQNEQRIIRRIS